MNRSNKDWFFKMLFKCIMTSTTATWQQAGHTTCYHLLATYNEEDGDTVQSHETRHPQSRRQSGSIRETEVHLQSRGHSRSVRETEAHLQWRRQSGYIRETGSTSTVKRQTGSIRETEVGGSQVISERQEYIYSEEDRARFYQRDRSTPPVKKIEPGSIKETEAHLQWRR